MGESLDARLRRTQSDAFWKQRNNVFQSHPTSVPMKTAGAGLFKPCLPARTHADFQTQPRADILLGLFPGYPRTFLRSGSLFPSIVQTSLRNPLLKQCLAVKLVPNQRIAASTNARLPRLNFRTQASKSFLSLTHLSGHGLSLCQNICRKLPRHDPHGKNPGAERESIPPQSPNLVANTAEVACLP